jgi:hypothetical protein
MVLACQMLAFWCGVKACGLTLTAPACAAVLMVVRLGTLLPAAPANVGTFQFACVMGMGLFSVSGAAAAAVSLVIFVLLTLPLWLIGGVCFAGAGLGWKALRVGAY